MTIMRINLLLIFIASATVIVLSYFLFQIGNHPLAGILDLIGIIGFILVAVLGYNGKRKTLQKKIVT